MLFSHIQQVHIEISLYIFKIIRLDFLLTSTMFYGELKTRQTDLDVMTLEVTYTTKIRLRSLIGFLRRTKENIGDIHIVGQNLISAHIEDLEQDQKVGALLGRGLLSKSMENQMMDGV